MNLSQLHHRNVVGLMYVAMSAMSAMSVAACASGAGARAPRAGAASRRAEPGSDGCSRDGDFGPAHVPASTYAARTGATATLFSELQPSTKEKPLEECGLPAVLKKLVALRCADGSNPFEGDVNQAHESRGGSVGPGGRCGSIIDAYDVNCPERSYQIFADLYVCPPGLGGE